MHEASKYGVERWLMRSYRQSSLHTKEYRGNPLRLTVGVAAMERVMGIEPTSKAWEAFVLPLNYTRMSVASNSIFKHVCADQVRADMMFVASQYASRDR